MIKLVTAIMTRWRGVQLPGHLRTGEWGERMAERHLRQKGYRILGRRVTVGLRDELDLIARAPNDVLVFVEVKARANTVYGRPEHAVNHRKRRALSRAARTYLKRLNPKPAYFRFDVVEVIGSPDAASEPEIRHIENAFLLLENKRINW